MTMLLAVYMVLVALTLAGDVTAMLTGDINVKVADIELHKEAQTLSVTPDGDVISVTLKPFTLYGISGLSFSGILSVDGQGCICGYEDMRMRGFPGLKIKSVTGTVSTEAADITIVVTALKGKVEVAFNFAT